ncbi:hypothetical protein CROQUDRAFT_651518 [Cronartium quercuum f. sp. fusiforme G11]|uniref:Uncharacterized protein n=1 Tax=Cronartium quercuum f. sp. fusiforme G11 TaxID=708437 RepID=A0A9P6NTD8_9BASI|nr:hypothetical protein CROQUDRAFT_651518 [Cronartium quercuum f. sp. fusiforme G11]
MLTSSMNPIELHPHPLHPIPFMSTQLQSPPRQVQPSQHPITLLDKIQEYALQGDQLAIVDTFTGISKTYQDLLEDVRTLSTSLFASVRDNAHAFSAQPVLNLLPSGYPWMITQLSLWSLHAINVPQAVTQAHRELVHVIKTGPIRIAICFESELEKLSNLGLQTIIILSNDGTRVLRTDSHPAITLSKSTTNKATNEVALMLFTSGTTGQPKGVPLTHSAIAQQCRSMGSAWEWKSKDRILHCLPLTHIHGIINALVVPIWYGATVEFLGTPFSPSNIWTRILDQKLEPITIFMAVPTIYYRLVNFIQADNGELIRRLCSISGSSVDQAEALKRACKKLRLMISGSAPLSTAIKDRWAALTSHILLERYGMTETGMILSCPLRPISGRLDGHVGLPLPGVTVRLRNTESGEIFDDDTREEQGEIEVSGPSVFTGYWGDRKWAGDYFTTDRFFRTGDIAVRSGSNGSYRLLGRSSTDIIKTGGEKVSALEIERVISGLEEVADVSVVGLLHKEWGQAVGCVLVLKPINSKRDLSDVTVLREALKSELSPFKLPKKVKIYEHEIPRNAMGKVQKPQLAKVAFPEFFED